MVEPREEPNRHSKENARGRHPTAINRGGRHERAGMKPTGATPTSPDYDLQKAVKDTKDLKRRLIHKATKEQRALAGIRRDLEDGTAEHPTFDARIEGLREPIMRPNDYQLRNNAIVDLAIRLQDNPESVGFTDLTQIMDAEEKDILAKKGELEEKGMKPFQAEWINLELSSVRNAREGLGIMIIGGEMEDDDPRALALDGYLRDKAEILEEGQNVALRESLKLDSPEKEEALRVLKVTDDAIIIFDTLHDKTLEYESPMEIPDQKQEV